jgi:hypothetical protein
MKRIVLILSLAVASPILAANRAFVSGTGIDTGTCPITAPCRSFAYALTQVSTGGEIIALDTAGYGAVNIAQSVMIIAAPGVTAFSTATSGTVIQVVGLTTDTVTLRGITVTANGPTTGVGFYSGHVLNLENCIINGHVFGVSFDRGMENGSPKLHMTNCIVRNNTSAGVDVLNSPGLAAKGGIADLAVAPPPNDLLYVTVATSAFLDNGNGLVARDRARVTVTDTVFSGQVGFGAGAQGEDGFPSIVALEHCTLSDNATGVQAGDTSGSQLIHGVVRLANCTITHNIIGLNTTASGSSATRVSNATLTNTIEGNYTDGVFSTTYSAK